MEGKVNNFFKNIPFSRREFLKYAGAATGLFLTRGGWGSKKAFAHGSCGNRVVVVKDNQVTTWDGSSIWFGSNTYVDQTRVNNMFIEGIKSLTGESTELAAWQSIIPTYSAGTKIAIKINYNNYAVLGNYSNPTPQVVNAILAGLVARGVAQGDILLADPSYGMDERFVALIHDHYPNIYYYTQFGNEITHPGANNVDSTFVNADPSLTIDFSDPGIPNGHLWDGLLTATYLIHVPIFRMHGSMGVTLTYKNMFGLFDRPFIPNFHDPYWQGSNNPVVDMWANSNVGAKSRLIIGDGIYGNWVSNGTVPTRWSIFGNDWPKRLFFATDPVAIDSVMWDFLYWQDPNHYRIVDGQNYLHEATTHGQGIHEHWNNPTEKKHSLIDFVQINMARWDVDRKIKDFKAGSATEQEVKDLINSYMETP